jgi:hypothetical protein
MLPIRNILLIYTNSLKPKEWEKINTPNLVKIGAAMLISDIVDFIAKKAKTYCQA